MESPVKLDQDELNKLLHNFEDVEGAGISGLDIVRLCSALLDTGAVRFVSPDMQSIVVSFISGGVLNFAGEILVPEDDIFNFVEDDLEGVDEEDDPLA